MHRQETHTRLFAPIRACLSATRRPTQPWCSVATCMWMRYAVEWRGSVGGRGGAECGAWRTPMWNSHVCITDCRPALLSQTRIVFWSVLDAMVLMVLL